jgi:hypothetical protein
MQEKTQATLGLGKLSGDLRSSMPGETQISTYNDKKTTLSSLLSSIAPKNLPLLSRCSSVQMNSDHFIE